MEEYWKRQRLKEICKHICIALLIITISIGMVIGIVKYFEQFYSKTEVRTVEVIDKEEHTQHSVIYCGKVLVPTTNYSYYLYGINGEKISVSSSVYNRIKKGDKVQTECTYVYYKKDNSLHKITYKYLGE